MENTQADIEENITQINETEESMTIINSNEDNNKKIDGRKDMKNKKKIKLTHSEERLQLLKQIVERNITPTQNELDETDLIFNSMAKIVKKLPRYEQVQLRMQLIIGNAELKRISSDLKQTDSSSSSITSIIHPETVPCNKWNIKLQRTNKWQVITNSEHWKRCYRMCP